MSLIGPRPITPDTYRCTAEAVQKEISTVLGLSGLGSIIFRSDMFMMEDDPDCLQISSHHIKAK